MIMWAWTRKNHKFPVIFLIIFLFSSFPPLISQYWNIEISIRRLAYKSQKTYIQILQHILFHILIQIETKFVTQFTIDFFEFIFVFFPLHFYLLRWFLWFKLYNLLEYIFYTADLYRFRKNWRTLRQIHANVVHKKLLNLKESYLCLSITETEKKTRSKNSECRYICMGLKPNYR